LLAEVALAAVVADVHGVSDELASATELGTERVWPEVGLLAVPEPEGAHAVGVRAVRGPALGGQFADQAARGSGAVTGTVTDGRERRLTFEVGSTHVHG
jgi:hypothetical protein